MIVKIPEGGCFYAIDNGVFVHSINNSRTTYYLPPGSLRLVQGSSSSGSFGSPPSGAFCLSNGDISVDDFTTDIVLPLISISIFVIIFMFFVKLLFRGWTK